MSIVGKDALLDEPDLVAAEVGLLQVFHLKYKPVFFSTNQCQHFTWDKLFYQWSIVWQDFYIAYKCDIILNADCGHLDKEVPLQHPQVVLADVQLQVQKVQEYI